MKYISLIIKLLSSLVAVSAYKSGLHGFVVKLEFPFTLKYKLLTNDCSKYYL